MLEFVRANWGNIASVAGLIVSMVGFWFAIAQIRRSRTAAEAAREAANAARDRIAANLTIADLTRASDRIQELKELHRVQAWSRVLDRYPEVRRSLVEIRERHPGLTPQQLGILQNAVSQISIMEGEVETALAGNSAPSGTRFNPILSRIQLTLDEAVAQLQRVP